MNFFWGFWLLWLIDHQRKLNPWNKSTCMCVHILACSLSSVKLNLWTFKVHAYPRKLNPTKSSDPAIQYIMLIKLLIILFSCSQCYITHCSNKLWPRNSRKIMNVVTVIIPCPECSTYINIIYTVWHVLYSCNNAFGSETCSDTTMSVLAI